MAHIFISYSRKDNDVVSKVDSALRAKGYVVWRDVDAIRGSEDFEKAIQLGINTASVVIIFWSANSSQSEWVKKELHLALQRQNNIPIFPVWLDKTPLLAELEKINAIRSFQDDFDSGITELLGQLPQNIRRERQGFKFDIPLNDQPLKTEIDGTALVSVPFLNSSYCKVAIVGEPTTIIQKPSAIQLCLQFTQSRGLPFISGVYEHIQKRGEGRPFIGLHVMGPDRPGEEYRLNNHNNAHWIDAVDTTYEAVIEISKRGKPIVEVYSIGPQVFTFALGMKFYRFWQVQLYNFIKDGEYARILEIMPE
jgi:hypothetical protein